MTRPSIVITGGSSGLGAELMKVFREFGWTTIDWSFPSIDLMHSHSVKEAAFRLDHLDVLINCAGVNHLDWLPEIDEENWDEVMGVNAKAIWLTAKYLSPLLRGGTILNVISNASHVPMTHSAAYNASKGAAHTLTLQMARELRQTHDMTVLGVSPNKMHSTRMSTYIDKRAAKLRGWSEEEAKAYQLKALATGEETDPKEVAEFIGYLLSTKQRHKFLHGCIIPYGA